MPPPTGHPGSACSQKGAWMTLSSERTGTVFVSRETHLSLSTSRIWKVLAISQKHKTSRSDSVRTTSTLWCAPSCFRIRMQSCLGWRTLHYSQNTFVTAGKVVASTTPVSVLLKRRSEVLRVRCCARDWVQRMAVVSSFPNRALTALRGRRPRPQMSKSRSQCVPAYWQHWGTSITPPGRT